MRFPKEYMEKYKEGVKLLKELYDELGSYRKVANHLPGNVNPGGVYQIIHKGYKPQSGLLLEALDLPLLTEKYDIVHCEVCGEILTPKHICPDPDENSTSGNDRPSRIRIDLDPDMSLEDAEKVRNLSRETRTRVLLMAAEVINR